MKEQITYDIHDKVDIRVGTVISVKKNEKARKPSLVVEVDFGKDIGIKQSSAQITHYYNEENLVGKQVTFYLSGWRGPSFLPIPGEFWFFAKWVGVIAIFIWFRATFPRLRIDQIMSLACGLKMVKLVTL